MAKAKNTSVELALTLVRKDHTISLLAGLALALSGMSCESPTRLKLSPAKSGIEKSTGKPGNGSLGLETGFEYRASLRPYLRGLGAGNSPRLPDL